MSKRTKLIKALTISTLIFCFSVCLQAQNQISPDTVTIKSGGLHLKGLLWLPPGKGPFPTVIFCHGTYETQDKRFDMIQQTSVLGPLFAKNGYAFLSLFRRGNGLSMGKGDNTADLLAKAFAEKGQDERNMVQIELMQNHDLLDITSGLTFLRERKDVDTNRLAIIGHSYGGSLALLAVAKHPDLKVVITFGAAGYSWNESPQLRTLLMDAVNDIEAPVMLVYTQNDYSLDPGYALDHAIDVLEKPHVLKIYPSFGSSSTEGHNFIFLSPATWEMDILNFLKKNFSSATSANAQHK